MIGWVKIHRELIESDIWLSEAFTRGQAWVDLICLCNHSDGYIRVCGERIPIKRGQCGWSQLNLSKRWKWGRGKVRRFLSELERDGSIELKTNTRSSIITICNYDKFQRQSEERGATNSTTEEHHANSKPSTNNNDKNGKNENNHFIGGKNAKLLSTKAERADAANTRAIKFIQ